MNIPPLYCDVLSTQHHHLESTESGGVTHEPHSEVLTEKRRDPGEGKEFVAEGRILAKAQNHREFKRSQ